MAGIPRPIRPGAASEALGSDALLARDRRGAGYLMNEQIRFPEVRVIGEEKEPLGIMPTSQALEMAMEAEVDLVLVTPDASPPVCRLVEWSKLKFEKEKADKDAKKKQKAGVMGEGARGWWPGVCKSDHVRAFERTVAASLRADMKELKLRPNTDVHDYQVRLRSAQKFIQKNNKVKIVVQVGRSGDDARGRGGAAGSTRPSPMTTFMHRLWHSSFLTPDESCLCPRHGPSSAGAPAMMNGNNSSSTDLSQGLGLVQTTFPRCTEHTTSTSAQPATAPLHAPPPPCTSAPCPRRRCGVGSSNSRTRRRRCSTGSSRTWARRLPWTRSRSSWGTKWC